MDVREIYTNDGGSRSVIMTVLVLIVVLQGAVNVWLWYSERFTASALADLQTEVDSPIIRQVILLLL